jgi:purine-binding chemotaxis protein CheW
MDRNENNTQSSFEKSRYLEFQLGSEKYAIELLSVKEVIPVPDTSPIPKSPPHFVGIMNLRGHVISIIDLRKKLQVQPSEDKSEEAVVIINIEHISIGMIVDNISRVMLVSEEDIKPVPKVDNNVNSSYINGVIQSEQQITTILDLTKLLDIADFLDKPMSA